jgi:hypothetical protein
MIRFLAAALLCALFAMPAEGKPHRQRPCIETGTVMVPLCMGQSSNFLVGVRSIDV